MTRLLITRPEPQATRTAMNFEKAGFAVVSAPMLEVAFHPAATRDLSVAVSAEAPQAILITSQHAAEALRDVPEASAHAILAVGPASADAAREAGAKDVSAAHGDAHSLLALVRERCRPNGGTLIYLRAADIAADLSGMLRSDGFEIVEILTYEARPVHRLPDAAAQALIGREIDAVLFYSARTAEIFLGVAAGQGLMPTLADVPAIAISETVAQLLRQSGWRRVSTLRLSDAETAPSLLHDLLEGRVRDDKAPARAAPEAAAPSPRESTAAVAPPPRRLRWEAWLLAATGLAGAWATAQYFLPLETGRRLGERPSQHRFAAHPPASAGRPAPEAGSSAGAAPQVGTLPAGMPAEATFIAPTTPPLPDDAANAQFEALQRQIDEQAERLEALEQQAAADRQAWVEESGKRSALGKLIRLRARIETGEPFTEELSDLLMADGAAEISDELGRIGDVAASGVATPLSLAAAFEAARRTAAARPPAPGFWNGVRAAAARLVVVRKIGAEQAGDDDGVILARSEAALANGEWQRALDETALLSSETAPSYAGFREALRRRIRTLGAIDAASARLAGPR